MEGHPLDAGATAGGITPAELRVLSYLPTHHTFGQIGEELFLSRNTVKSHAMAIYRKLDVSSRSDAVAEARRLRLLDPWPRWRSGQA